ncbi:hypothetical protein DPMN_091069 [Dreissena polymorpha]|uniref:Uncharacterized protein n=1 Tax=Dreissena polymorpha TaxID=45954 RepID=A0A9D4KZX9_DREPO|nr:hypothetical protein DPMN_091069 [Dreissena polymorpha]
MLRNKDKPVKCQLPLPAKHELYVSGLRNYRFKLNGELHNGKGLSDHKPDYGSISHLKHH